METISYIIPEIRHALIGSSSFKGGPAIHKYLPQKAENRVPVSEHGRKETKGKASQPNAAFYRSFVVSFRVSLSHPGYIGRTTVGTRAVLREEQITTPLGVSISTALFSYSCINGPYIYAQGGTRYDTARWRIYLHQRAKCRRSISLIPIQLNTPMGARMYPINTVTAKTLSIQFPASFGVKETFH